MRPQKREAVDAMMVAGVSERPDVSGWECAEGAIGTETR